MPPVKALPYNIVLAIAALSSAGSSYANAAPTSGTSVWNCSLTADGRWHCNHEPSGKIKAPLVSAGNTLVSRYQKLDWISQPNGLACQGRYIEPQFQRHGDEEDAAPPVYLNAGNVKSALDGGTELRNQVYLRQGKQRLSSEQADINQAQDQAHFKTDVIYREPGVLVTASDATVNLNSHQGRFHNAQFVLHEDHLRGKATEIRRDPDNTFTLENGQYTFCPPGNEDWQISASTISLDDTTGFGVARNATLKVGPVPIFYSPYLSFPIDERRQSGFLYPDISYAKSNGLDLSAPYYFNLAPNYDDTLTPRWIGERGVLLENEFRYLSERYNTQFGLAYLPDDKLFLDDRWLARLTTRGRPAEGWHSLIDYTTVSDNDYFDDLDTGLNVERVSHLNRKGQLTYYGNNWNALARLHSYQSLVSGTKPYRRLPQLQLNGNNDLEFAQLNYQTEYVYFDRDIDGLTGSDRLTGSRFHFTPKLSKRYSRNWGYLSPSVSLWNTQYSLNNQIEGVNGTPGYSIPVASLDSGLVFERDLETGGLQTLEPRLFMLYIPDKDQTAAPDFDTSLLNFDYRSLFRTNRFSGRDRIGDAQKISLGLTSRLFESNGYERASISAGQAFYLDDRDVVLSGSAETAKQSDIALEAVWNYNGHLKITLDNVLAYSNLDTKETNIRLSYQESVDQQVNFSYRFEEDTREQTDLHFIWPLSPRWTTLGRWQHNFKDTTDLETVLGLEYESCCWKLQLTGRRWLTDTDTHDSGLFLRFILKGLGSISSSNTGFLNDITGFKARDLQDDF
ncbi:MAG: LPS-assembly protein LptD [Pontibacterium sp.]